MGYEPLRRAERRQIFRRAGRLHERFAHGRLLDAAHEVSHENEVFAHHILRRADQEDQVHALLAILERYALAASPGSHDDLADAIRPCVGKGDAVADRSWVGFLPFEHFLLEAAPIEHMRAGRHDGGQAGDGFYLAAGLEFQFNPVGRQHIKNGEGHG